MSARLRMIQRPLIVLADSLTGLPNPTAIILPSGEKALALDGMFKSKEVSLWSNVFHTRNIPSSPEVAKEPLDVTDIPIGLDE